jgi:hypothetical protein
MDGDGRIVAFKVMHVALGPQSIKKQTNEVTSAREQLPSARGIVGIQLPWRTNPTEAGLQCLLVQ